MWRGKPKKSTKPRLTEEEREERRSKPNLQQLINSSDGEINEYQYELLISQMEEEGWRLLEDNDFSKLLLGDRIRYTIIDPKGRYVFRTGGWVLNIDLNNKWLIYRGHTVRGWSLQQDNCREVYVLSRTDNVDEK